MRLVLAGHSLAPPAEAAPAAPETSLVTTLASSASASLQSLAQLSCQLSCATLASPRSLRTLSGTMSLSSLAGCRCSGVMGGGGHRLHIRALELLEAVVRSAEVGGGGFSDELLAGLLGYVRCRDRFTALHAAKTMLRLTRAANLRGRVWGAFHADAGAEGAGGGGAGAGATLGHFVSLLRAVITVNVGRAGRGGVQGRAGGHGHGPEGGGESGEGAGEVQEPGGRKAGEADGDPATPAGDEADMPGPADAALEQVGGGGTGPEGGIAGAEGRREAQNVDDDLLVAGEAQEQEVLREVQEVVDDMMEAVAYWADVARQTQRAAVDRDGDATTGDHNAATAPPHTSKLRPKPPATQRKRRAPALPCGVPLERPSAREKAVRASAHQRDKAPQQPAVKDPPLRARKSWDNHTGEQGGVGVETSGHTGEWKAGEEGAVEEEVQLLLFETCWALMGPSNPHHQVCVEGLIREGLFDVILLLLRERVGQPVSDVDLLAIKMFRRMLATIGELSARRLSRRALETSVLIMLRHKDAMQTEPWVHLDETGMAMLASLSQVLSFEPGERVVAQGAHDACAYLVLSGLLQTFYTSKTYQQKHTLTKLRPGDIVGSLSLLPEHAPACAATVTATSKALLVQIPRHALLIVAGACALAPLRSALQQAANAPPHTHESLAQPGRPSSRHSASDKLPAEGSEAGTWGGGASGGAKGKGERKKVAAALARRAAGQFALALGRLSDLLQMLLAPSRHGL